MPHRTLFDATILFGFTALFLAVLLHHRQVWLLDLFMPLHRWTLAALLSGFHIDALDWRIEHGETVVALDVTLEEYRVIDGKIIAPGIDIKASTLAASAWTHPAVMLALALAWPQRRSWHRFTALLAVAPFAAVAVVLDTSLMLWSSVEDFLYWATDADHAAMAYGAMIQRYWAGGGRYAATILLALGAMLLHALVLRAPMHPEGNGIKPGKKPFGRHSR